MTTRLERLFVLLESGTSATTRRAAARQLGDVQRAHPHELHRLLARLLTYLRSTTWETRIAAGQAVDAILSSVPQWEPAPRPKELSAELRNGYHSNEEPKLLAFSTFDLDHVLENGASLMGSDGLDCEDSESSSDSKDKIEAQKKLLQMNLGFAVGCNLGLDFNELCTNEDLMINNSGQNKSTEDENKKPLWEVIYGEGLSSREKNRARRLARQALGKQRSREDENSDDAQTPKKMKVEPVFEAPAEPVPSCDGRWEEDISAWPLQWWWSIVANGLFAGSWEHRHGCATAARELLRTHARAPGRKANMTASQMEEANQCCLEDISLRLICVLALDKFGDFVSDQVVAPVRETCAQALGVCGSRLTLSRAEHCVKLLRQLAGRPQWEARHGAVLGLKYLATSRTELRTQSLETLRQLLGDSVEDVSGAAAQALAAAGPGAVKAEVLPILWEHLSCKDDLDAAANHYMALLASILSSPEKDDLPPIQLHDLLPRLWPYLDHSASSVRKATLMTLKTLTKPMEYQNGVRQKRPSDHTYHIVEKPRNDIETIIKTIKMTIEDDEHHFQWKGPDWKRLDMEIPKLAWTPELLQQAMRYIFQRVLLEHMLDIQLIAEEVWVNLVLFSTLDVLLSASCPIISTWICLIMQPVRMPIDPIHLIKPEGIQIRKRDLSENEEAALSSGKAYLGGGENVPQNVREQNVVQTRIIASRMIGLLSRYIIKPAPGIEYNESPVDYYTKVLEVHLGSRGALQRLVAALTVFAWSSIDQEFNFSETSLPSALHSALAAKVYCEELIHQVNKLLQETSDLVAMLKHYKLPVESAEFTQIRSLEKVINAMRAAEPLISTLKQKRVIQSLGERRSTILSSALQLVDEQNNYNISLESTLAMACVGTCAWGERINPILKPLMENIKKEPQEPLQRLAARALALALSHTSEKAHAPNNKVASNLKTFLCCDPEHTPNVIIDEEIDDGSGDSDVECFTPKNLATTYSGILTMVVWERFKSRTAAKKYRGPGRPSLSAQTFEPVEDQEQKELSIQRRGAVLALTSLAKYFADELPRKLPKLWELITSPCLGTIDIDDPTLENSTELIHCLQVLETVCPMLGPTCSSAILSKLSQLSELLGHTYTAVRYAAARALASIASTHPAAVAQLLVGKVLPLLEDCNAERVRCGSVEAIAQVVDRLQIQIVPYIVLLVVPLLGRMSDHCEAIRLMSTRTFASLIQLMPLEGAVPEPEDLSEDLKARKTLDKDFLDQLFHPKNISDYKLPFNINTELRSYQQAGINWLRFLQRYRLHGVLCDDMGLGKTLQSICAVASEHYEREKAGLPSLPSLVVCPPTLTGHWVYEVCKFIPRHVLNPLHYCGLPMEREKLKTIVKNHNLVVASYDILRKDIHFFSSIKWNYCVLDEGHIVKNGKTKVFKAIKLLIANHRLILSGTPIQNNVLELWTLFDFLMPGLLGTVRQFNARYGRPILAARDPKASQQQQQSAALALEALHRQVLPFLLRRVKEDVLKELPPKITLDYYCDLSPLQRRLYEDFSKTHLPGGAMPTSHVFHALRYLQNVCNHPKLVLTEQHPERAIVMDKLNTLQTSLDSIEHAAKLTALKQLLEDCGIGLSYDSAIVSQHRALIFCQLKSMLDIVEKDLLKKHLPSVTYLRLDGSVPPALRHSLVTRFNDDVSIDVLLLTTRVGGLGLNLTGADTVIFVEHDWNPSADLQAMDRAHRIGQKRCVNVYRLITRGTLEEKIMGLQKFKLKTANTVISGENSSFENMNTDQLFDLFHLSSDGQNVDGCGHASNGGLNSGLGGLPELWDQAQYDEEYDMSTFIKSLQTDI